MNKIFITLICFLTFQNIVIAGELNNNQVPQQGYTTDILRDPLYNPAEVAVGAVRINNWLIANYEKLTYEQMKGPRERIYYLIDSHIKSLYQKEKRIIPEKPDFILSMLFSWTERLGVYGGTKIYNSMRPPKSAPKPSTMKFPASFSLALQGDRLEVADKEEGWSLKVPYYFMIGRIQEFKATNGMQTKLVIISTGTAADTSKAGRSQATIMLIYSAGSNLINFTDYWKKMLEINDKAQELIIKSNGQKSLHTFSPAEKMHKELVTWQEKRGVFAVVYLGMDGTYQWNRPHFLDFLRSLKVK